MLVWELRQLGRVRPTETVVRGVIERLRSEPLAPDAGATVTRLR